jgi:hypothetical protein
LPNPLVVGRFGGERQTRGGEVRARRRVGWLEGVRLGRRARPQLDPLFAPTADVAREDGQAPATGHVLFVGGPDGYRLREADGPPPAPGTELRPDEDGGATLVVVKVGRSPLPGDRRPCAYAERLA